MKTKFRNPSQLCRLAKQFSTSTGYTQLPRLDHRGLEDDLVPFLPHLRLQRLPRNHRPRKPDLDVLEQPIPLHNVLTADAEEAQPVQNRILEPADLGELGVDVQRVVIARQSIQRRLIRRRLLLGHGVWRAAGRLVRGAGTPSVLAGLVAAEAAGAADEHGTLLVEQGFAGRGVLGRGAGDDDAGGTFVQDVDELWLADDASGGGDGVF